MIAGFEIERSVPSNRPHDRNIVRLFPPSTFRLDNQAMETDGRFLRLTAALNKLPEITLAVLKRLPILNLQTIPAFASISLVEVPAPMLALALMISHPSDGGVRVTCA